MLVLDEVETLQRVRGDVREKALNALRQLIDEVDGGRFPGLYLLITGTPAFFDGPQGVQRLPPLAQRLHVDFRPDPGSTTRGPSRSACRLRPRPARRGRRAGPRHLCARAPRRGADRCARATTPTSRDLAAAVTGELGGKVGVAPRLFLKKLVGDVLDRDRPVPRLRPAAALRA